jgi:hypothetical protein
MRMKEHKAVSHDIGAGQHSASGVHSWAAETVQHSPEAEAQAWTSLALQHQHQRQRQRQHQHQQQQQQQQQRRLRFARH